MLLELWLPEVLDVKRVYKNVIYTAITLDSFVISPHVRVLKTNAGISNGHRR